MFGKVSKNFENILETYNGNLKLIRENFKNNLRKFPETPPKSCQKFKKNLGTCDEIFEKFLRNVR